LAFLMPTRLAAAFSWLLIPLLVFAAVPLVILGTLLLVQAPIFSSASPEEAPPQS
jgi:hypothetical protein